MNKNEIIDKLKAAGVEFSPDATKVELEQLLPDYSNAPSKDRMVKVTNHRKQPLVEGSQRALPGESLQITPERAKGLKSWVNPPKPKTAEDEGAE